MNNSRSVQDPTEISANQIKYLFIVLLACYNFVNIEKMTECIVSQLN